MTKRDFGERIILLITLLQEEALEAVRRTGDDPVGTRSYEDGYNQGYTDAFTHIIGALREGIEHMPDEEVT